MHIIFRNLDKSNNDLTITVIIHLDLQHVAEHNMFVEKYPIVIQVIREILTPN
uniref:Uncharacterized protein n=1 Tax=Tetranychus urticae TaxID=32264 RepID=T1JY03_TETUR